ncbi:cytochrome c biogenesis protein ResB [Austwickia sp. TVS 96-490-7B]|uniref:cytochrome c biogenesis protein ResB n=1 Tax=Austwickia sp. TVS 96-490-7B TaxID=2830843 RepID=UPI001C5A49CF|nr:cytochrome c biogenesis protein ResB [Austwickia sp. TVS 96-490-7B]
MDEQPHDEHPTGSTPARNAPSPQANTAVLPELGPVGLARWAWRQLTSMKTALFLLLLTAIAAVPGSVFPQRAVDAPRVAEWIADHPDSGPWLDRIGMFDVFSSPWFSAIYLLLMTSLVGCLIPRTRQHLQNLRSQPPRAPSRLDRLPVHEERIVIGDVSEVTARARTALGRRYRQRRDDDPAVVSAETGYLRESGNLIFHAALLVLIVAVAWGHLVGWRGDRIVPVGQSFSNSVGSYDTFSPGPWVDTDALSPFTVRIDSLDVRFETDPRAGAQVGAPRDFRARTTITERPGAPVTRRELAVNSPLSFGGAQVYLLGNGYAPMITVRDRAGKVLFHQHVVFLPQDADYTSVGAVKVTGATPRQLGLVGMFLPTAGTSADGTVRSTFPAPTNPALVLGVYEGNLFPAGRSQSVYSLDVSAMTPVKDESGALTRLTLAPGQTVRLPGDRGSVTFDAVERWAGVSTRYDPARPLALGSAVIAALALVASLTVRRRRVFVRVTAAPDGPEGVRRSTVQIAALAKHDDPALGAMVTRLLDSIDAAGRPSNELVPAQEPFGTKRTLS